MGGLISFFKWIGDALKGVIEFIVSLPGLLVSLFASIGSVIQSALYYFNSLCTDTSITNQVASSISNFSQMVGSQGGVFDTLSWAGALDVAFDILSSLIILFVGFWTTFALSVIIAFIGVIVSVYSFRLVAKAINICLPFMRL